jgi:hypothetical protein
MPSNRPPPGLVACFHCSGRGCPDCNGAGFVTLQKRQQQRQQCDRYIPPTAPSGHITPLYEAQAEIERLRAFISRTLADRQKIAVQAAANERVAILALVDEALEASDTMGALMRLHDDIKARDTAGS